MCLLEVYYHLIKTTSKESAMQWYHSFLKIVVEPTDEEIIESAENRAMINSKISGRKISHIDALGYTIAKKEVCYS